MDIYWTIIFLLIGLSFGSFFNVVGLRVPKKVPFSNDRSYCPTCNNQLLWYELIPVLSYVIQRGKCRNCHTQISIIYPIVECLTAVLFSYSYWQIGFQVELILVLLFISMLMILFVSDVTYMLIPDKVLLFFLPLFVILRIAQPLDPWYNAISGAVVGYVLIAIIILASKGGMGAGDMKLFGVLGIVLGLGKTLLTLFLAALLGALIGGMLMAMKKVKKKQPIPFGPYIVVAALISYFYGERIITAYIALL